MRSLEESMKLTFECLLAWLDPENGYFPTGGYEVAHDTGRWWDAMLRMESVTGMQIPDWAENAMLRNIMTLTDNKSGFLQNRPDIEFMKEKTFFNPHNIRETMLALAALVKYRNNKWAAEKGIRILRTLNENENPDGSYNYLKISELTGLPVRNVNMLFAMDGTTAEGRALEAIILFYQATGERLAYDTAEKIAQRHFNKTINDDGSIPEHIISEDNIGHNHSYLGTLRGLLKFGLMTGKNEYIEAVAKTYKNSIYTNNLSYAGWAPHDLGMRRFNNEDGDPEGDPASCGDAAQIALWLALNNGQTGLLDDVERLVKARLLPQQITGDPNPRNNGAWGIYRHPFGFGVILDVFAAVLHTLTDIYANIITESNGSKLINMHFDINTPAVDVMVKNNERRAMRIKVKDGIGVGIRIPGWVDRKTISVGTGDFVYDGDYLMIGKELIKKNPVFELSFDLPINETVEKMKVSGREFKLTWRGDEVAACSPEVPMYMNIS